MSATNTATIDREVGTINIWIGNLAKYTEGRLVGEWVSLPMPEEDLKATMARILGNDEECEIFDWECEIDRIVNPHSNPFKLNEIAERLENLDSDDWKRVQHLRDHGESIEFAMDNYEDVTIYVGDYKDVAYELVEAGCFGDIPEHLSNYIDYEAIGRDLRFGGGYHYDSDQHLTFHYCG